MKQRIYIDTSVVGGYFDAEFAEDTVPFFESVKNGERIIVLSDLLEKELLKSPEYVRKLLPAIPSIHKEFVVVSPEVRLLANKYVEAKVVGKTSLDDCIHIAAAPVFRADVLVSWNFKHIVNLPRIKGYNAINYLHGYAMLEIRTPKEIMNYEHD
jgi:predicted nucleic acid-binding protein